MSGMAKATAVNAVGRLSEITEPVSYAVLELHKPDVSDFWHTVYCLGCDMGCGCEAARWPCSTVRLIAEIYDIDIPREWEVDWSEVLNIKESEKPCLKAIEQ